MYNKNNLVLIIIFSWALSLTKILLFVNLDGNKSCVHSFQTSCCYCCCYCFFFFFATLCGLQPWLLHQGLTPSLPEWRQRVLTTRTPGNSLNLLDFSVFCSQETKLLVKSLYKKNFWLFRQYKHVYVRNQNPYSCKFTEFSKLQTWHVAIESNSTKVGENVTKIKYKINTNLFEQ